MPSRWPGRGPWWRADVWRSHLISHAAVNQRFVIAANVADPGEHCPSMIISPRGEVLGELPAGRTAVLRAVIDTEDTSDWFLSQRRADVVRLHYLPSDNDRDCPAITYPEDRARGEHGT